MKKTASHVVFLALALVVAHAFAGDADTSPLRLSPVKIPKCQKAHVCKDLPYGGRQVGQGGAFAIWGAGCGEGLRAQLRAAKLRGTRYGTQ